MLKRNAPILRYQLYFRIALFSLLLAGCMPEKEKEPNVIFILTDQWRASALGYAGNSDVKTPYLDAYSKEAVNFKNTVAVTPVCTPYRAALLTGKYPSTTGMFLNDLYLPAEELTMAEIYREAGYQTAYLGKWHLDGHGRKAFVAPERRQGFEYWKASECDHNHLNEHYYANQDTSRRHWEGYSPFAIVEDAGRYMERALEKDEPFLLFLSLTSPHFPHESVPKEYVERYPADSLRLPENVTPNMEEWALKELAGYYAHCTATDEAIGGLIQKIKDLGIFENSILVFTSDHGEMMGAHGYRPYIKHQPFLESANIPFLISYPEKGVGKGQTAEAPLTTPDILPSLLSLSGIQVPAEVEGYDLSGIMSDPSAAPDRAALFMNLCPFGIAFPDDEYRAIKTRQYTYVKTPDGASMLFDDLKDPLQMNNVVGNTNYDEVKARLDAQLKSELGLIGEDSIYRRIHYTEKFGYEGHPRIRADYHPIVGKPFSNDQVISPGKKMSE